MYIFGYFLQALASILSIALDVAMVVIIARAVLSWVSPDPYNPVVRIIHQLSEPLLSPLRRRIPSFNGIDLSPIIVLMVIYFLEIFLVQTLIRISVMLST